MMGRETEHLSHQPDDFSVKSLENTSRSNASVELPVLNGDSSASENGKSTRSASDIADMRANLQKQLDGSTGKKYWRSFNELAETDEFRDIVEHEFPAGADQMLDPVTRRSFMKVMGASFALAGLSACVRQPEEKIIPYVKQPEIMVPGNPLYFASAVTLGGFANGTVVTSNEGRPTKIDGNKEHPATLGGSDVFMQAEVLQMYDPDRSQAVLNRGRIGSWDAFTAAVTAKLGSLNGGEGLRLVTGAISSPSLRKQLDDFFAANPNAKWHTYESAPLSSAARIPNYDLKKADIVVALDSDLLNGVPGSLRFARDFGWRRNPDNNNGTMNRMYVAEAMPTPTGTIADHRLSVRSIDIWKIAAAIAAGVGADTAGATAGQLPEGSETVVNAIIDDLKKHNGKAVVAAGESQPASVHRMVESINQAIGAVGNTVTYVDSPVSGAGVDPFASLRSLTADIKEGKVDTLIVMGTNPVYDAPADLDFASAFSQVPLRIHHGLYVDETAYLSHWHVPASHSLESWGDAVAYDGTVSIIQPLIAPLYASTLSQTGFVAVLAGDLLAKEYDIVRGFWEGKLPGNFEKSWRKALFDGVVTGATLSAPTTGGAVAATAPSTASDSTATPAPADMGSGMSYSVPEDAGGLEVNIRPDPSIWDGRYNNNGWLQELPKPLTKLTWDNAVLMSPKTAKEYNVENGDIVELELDGRKVSGPVWLMPGHAHKSVTIHMGYGRERTGRVGTDVGFNANLIRTSATPWFSTGLKMSKGRGSHLLVSTQDHGKLDNDRNIYREVTLESFIGNPEIINEMEHVPLEELEELSFYSSGGWDYTKGYQWAMTIDLNACTGCNACTIACQSENNIPVVGKDQVANGREMHWIRLDRYFRVEDSDEDMNNPTIHNQPVPCMQCEQAPCEVVCPVAATVHGAEGLNDMVYNRCVGTRYCSNNCPYKVRRFNFLQYVDEDTETYRLMRNPDVSVRTRGVMEKCTYCVQRINRARISAKIDNRTIADGEVVSACQQACPTGAITFGNKNDAESAVAKNRKHKRNFGMLLELNTRPRTTYLARLTNPHASLATTPAHDEGHHAAATAKTEDAA